MMSFKHYIQNLELQEAVRMTQPKPVQDAGLGSDVYSIKAVIDAAYQRIVSGTYESNIQDNEGNLKLSPVVDCKVAARYKGKYEIIPIKIAVADPKYFKYHPKGMSLGMRPLIVIWWDKKNLQGISQANNSSYGPEDLYVTISHEVIHKLDKSIQLKEKQTATEDPWYSSEDGEQWKKNNWIYKDDIDRWGNSIHQNRVDSDKKKKYINAPHEVLARRDSFAYELARRLAATGSARSTGSDSYEVGNYHINSLLNQLNQITPDNMHEFITISPQSTFWYKNNPKEFKRILANAYRYLMDIYNQGYDDRQAPSIQDRLTQRQSSSRWNRDRDQAARIRRNTTIATTPREKFSKSMGNVFGRGGLVRSAANTILPR